MSMLLAALVALLLYAFVRMLNLTSPLLPPDIYAKTRSSSFVQALLSSCPILREPYAPPLLWGKSGHLQTVVYAKVGRMQIPSPSGSRHSKTLQDGSTLTFDLYPPTASHQTNGDYCLLVCPGIGSSSESAYIRALVNHAQVNGYHIAVLNHLGSIFSLKLTAPRIFSYGGWEEFHIMRQEVEHLYPQCKLIMVGLSMGANIVLKYLGEKPQHQRGVWCALSICQGYNINDAKRLLKQWENMRRVYLYMMTANQRRLLKHHSDILMADNVLKRFNFDLKKIFSATTLEELDVQFTSKLLGYDNIVDYYETCSCSRYIDRVDVPVVFLNSEDDPIVPPYLFKYPREYTENHEQSMFVTTKYGGHLGYFESGFIRPVATSWIDRFICQVADAAIAFRLQQESSPRSFTLQTKKPHTVTHQSNDGSPQLHKMPGLSPGEKTFKIKDTASSNSWDFNMDALSPDSTQNDEGLFCSQGEELSRQNARNVQSCHAVEECDRRSMDDSSMTHTSLLDQSAMTPESCRDDSGIADTQEGLAEVETTVMTEMDTSSLELHHVGVPAGKDPQLTQREKPGENEYVDKSDSDRQEPREKSTMNQQETEPGSDQQTGREDPELCQQQEREKPVPHRHDEASPNQQPGKTDPDVYQQHNREKPAVNQHRNEPGSNQQPGRNEPDQYTEDGLHGVEPGSDQTGRTKTDQVNRTRTDQISRTRMDQREAEPSQQSQVESEDKPTITAKTEAGRDTCQPLSYVSGENIQEESTMHSTEEIPDSVQHQKASEDKPTIAVKTEAGSDTCQPLSDVSGEDNQRKSTSHSKEEIADPPQRHETASKDKQTVTVRRTSDKDTCQPSAATVEESTQEENTSLPTEERPQSAQQCETESEDKLTAVVGTEADRDVRQHSSIITVQNTQGDSTRHSAMPPSSQGDALPLNQGRLPCNGGVSQDVGEDSRDGIGVIGSDDRNLNTNTGSVSSEEIQEDQCIDTGIGCLSLETVQQQGASTGVEDKNVLTTADKRSLSADGNVTSADRNVSPAAGDIIYTDGNIIADGTTSDGNMTSADGIMTSPNGNMASTSGSPAPTAESLNSMDGNTASSPW